MGPSDETKASHFSWDVTIKIPPCSEAVRASMAKMLFLLTGRDDVFI
jgi:hypothetical protein